MLLLASSVCGLIHAKALGKMFGLVLASRAVKERKTASETSDNMDGLS